MAALALGRDDAALPQSAPVARDMTTTFKSFSVARGWVRCECWGSLSSSHMFEWQLCGTRGLSAISSHWSGSMFASVCLAISQHESEEATPWDTLFHNDGSRCAEVERLWREVESRNTEDELKAMREARYNAAVHASSLRARAIAEERFCLAAGGQRPLSEQFRWDGYLGITVSLKFTNIAELVSSAIGRWLDEHVGPATLFIHSKSKLWRSDGQGLAIFASHRNEQINQSCFPAEIADAEYDVTEAASAEMYRLLQRSNSNSLAVELDGRVLQIFRKLVSDNGSPSNTIAKKWTMRIEARLHGCSDQGATADFSLYPKTDARDSQRALQWKVVICVTRWMANEGDRKTYKCEEKHTILCAASLRMVNDLN